MRLVAIGFTRSPALIAGLAFAFTLPWALFALPAGAIADRLDRRRLMLGANIVRTSLLAAFMLAVLLDAGSIWALYAVALCVGTAETIYDTAAQSIVPQVVPRDQLPPGVFNFASSATQAILSCTRSDPHPPWG